MDGGEDQRVGVSGIHEDTAREFVPYDLCLMDVEEGFASVRQNGSSLPTKREIERRDKRGRQG